MAHEGRRRLGDLGPMQERARYAESVVEDRVARVSL